MPFLCSTLFSITGTSVLLTVLDLDVTIIEADRGLAVLDNSSQQLTDADHSQENRGKLS